MKLLVVGGGGREHAIVRAAAQSRDMAVYAVMSRKNPGIAELCTDVLITKETEINGIISFCRKHQIEYAFIGPESPLEAGIADELTKIGIPCVGPCRNAARIETNKAFCRDLMRKYSIPGLPGYQVFHDVKNAISFLHEHPAEYALKPLGLTGGKGVRIMGEHIDMQGAEEYIRELGGDVVIEERLIGEEFTLQAFVDGNHLAPMPLVQDHKRAYDGDTGPNTGGMGTYTMPDHRMPFVTDAEYTDALAIMQKAVDALRAEGTPYVGVLYGQFMNTRNGPMVIEFNARFGDPEAMNLLSILKTDMGEIVRGIVEGRLDTVQIEFEQKATVCKYLVPEGYPDNPVSGGVIQVPQNSEALLYYASVILQDGKLLTQSSRSMAYVGIGENLDTAEKKAEKAAASVIGPVRHRTDIGTSRVLQKRIDHMQEIR